MYCAARAAETGLSAAVAEHGKSLGRKLGITGKGRCNVTNDADSDAFFKNIPRNPRFLYSCYAAFDNRALMKRIEDAGVKLKVERGGRVFPQSDKASDITKALERMMSKSGVRVCLRSKVKEILPSDGGFDLCLPGHTAPTARHRTSGAVRETERHVRRPTAGGLVQRQQILTQTTTQMKTHV